jgi:hypothetical protein
MRGLLAGKYLVPSGPGRFFVSLLNGIVDSYVTNATTETPGTTLLNGSEDTIVISALTPRVNPYKPAGGSNINKFLPSITL